MDLDYLDRVLTYLAKKKATILSTEILAEESLEGGDLMDALSFLQSNGYALMYNYPLAQKAPFWHVSITTKGILFQNHGGFVEEEKIKRIPLKELKISKVALWVGIISLIVAAIALFVSLKSNK
jgi:hypothetical protein